MIWTDCPLVESVQGKHSGSPVLVGTRVPPEAIVENYDSFLDEGLTSSEAINETADCYPSVGVERIKAVLEYRAAHELQLQS
jgi:uncharacterized protein (DUF433 family)